jgi:hypothetical protein
LGGFTRTLGKMQIFYKSVRVAEGVFYSFFCLSGYLFCFLYDVLMLGKLFSVFWIFICLIFAFFVLFFLWEGFCGFSVVFLFFGVF